MRQTAQPAEALWPEHTEEDLFASLAPGRIVLTATNRLARELRGRLARWHLEHGRQIWQTPEILPYSTWLAQQYQTLWRGQTETQWPRLLTPAQELAVWEDVLQQSPEGRRLLNTGATARSAREAWQLWQEYGLQETALQAQAGPDTEAFLGWADAFSQRCHRGQWVDAGRLPQVLLDVLAQGQWVVPSQITLAGFDLVSPAQHKLFTALEAAGSRVFVLWQELDPGAIQRVASPDVRQEMDDAARWARGRLEASPSARIGIVVPNLQAVREEILETLEAVLEPQRLLPQGATAASCINVSLGGSVAETAVGRCALGLLRLGRTTIKAEELGVLLRSRHWAGGESEWAARATLEGALYAVGEPQWTRTLVEFFLAGRSAVSCPETAEALQRLWAHLDELPRQQSWRQWAASFDHVLHIVGWPGDAGLPSAAYQAVEAWQECLQTLEEFDQVLGPTGYSEALHRLEQLARETIFQPESGQHPVQVLGLLEAAGSRFDAVWVMGLSDEVWPPAARPHPLLPHTVQLDHDMPHSSAQRELRFARQVTRRLTTAAPEVVFSLPQRDGDRAVQPSPLITPYPERQREELLSTTRPSLWQHLGHGGGVQWWSDVPAPALASGTLVRGGAGALKAQALCPFQAFARYRLQAAAVQPPEPGLTALDRGNLVHKAMEGFWSRMETFDRLQAASEERLAAVAGDAAQQAVDELAASRPMTLAGRYRELEQERLTRLLSQWALRELERAPFVVAEREHRVERDFAGARLRVVCDRVDRLEDGRLVIVDYKTGEVHVGDWFGERVLEPQLPLYAVLAEDEVAGVCVARLKTGHMAYSGVAADTQVHPGFQACAALKANTEGLDWPGLVALWRERLAQLVGEYLEGQSAVAPVDETRSCTFCELSSLCRLKDRERYAFS